MTGEPRTPERMKAGAEEIVSVHCPSKQAAHQHLVQTATDVLSLLTMLDEARKENERLRAQGQRVEYAWENLRGWMPNGRGVKNWTQELNAAVGAITAERYRS